MSEPRLDAALERTLLAARDKREKVGAGRDGMLTLAGLEAEEALAIDGLLTPRRPILAGQTRRIALSQFEGALRAGGIEPRLVYERVGGRPLRDLPAERASAKLTQAQFRTWLTEHPVATERPAIGAWLEEAARQGQVHAGMRPVIERALRIVAALPSAEPIQRTVLAAGLLDADPHGLDVDTPLHRLTVSLLAAAAGLDRDTSARAIWATWNVLVDPISSNVAVLNLPLSVNANPDGSADADADAGRLPRMIRGTHMILTYGQLSASQLQWPPGATCFSCENPSVLIAAEQALGADCPPLICTGGRPSDAVRLILSSARDAGASIRHHGDYDSAGVQILQDLEARYGAEPWRFDVPSMRAALRRFGRIVPDPSPATLEEGVDRLDRGLPEELVLDELLDDLRVAVPGPPSAA
jgi:uncharacterized protein (TIGR02679 family)